MSTGPLAGVRIADFSRVLAGPHATMILADFGADVIKIESPEGDGTRQWSPPSNALGQSTYYAGTNRGKRSVVIDLKDEAGLELAYKYAATADVVIENFKPGTMEKFGLGYERLAAENPGLVYCSISGFGDGAGASLPGYDLLVQAVGGLMSITGPETGEPSKVGVALVDIITGLNAVIGIQAALRARETTGRGQLIKLSLLQSLLSALANQAASTLETGTSPARMGNAHPSISPYETFQTQDQTIALAVGTNAQFARLVELLGIPELAHDKRFRENVDRVAHRGELKSTLEEQLRLQPAQHWVDACADVNIPAGRVNTIQQAFELAEELGLDVVAKTGDISTVANPIQLSDTPVTYTLAPPQLGQHQDAWWHEQ